MPSRFCTCQDCAHAGHQAVYPKTAAPGQRCPACQQAHDAQRPKTAARGYGSKHQQLRAKLIAQFTPGQPCTHCGKPMTSADELDLAHKADRSGYRGLAHAACNRGNR